MIHSVRRKSRFFLMSLTCVAILAIGPLFAAKTAEDILKAIEGKDSLIVVVGSGDAATPR